jgi:hypothetical protein
MAEVRVTRWAVEEDMFENPQAQALRDSRETWSLDYAWGQYQDNVQYFYQAAVVHDDPGPAIRMTFIWERA